MKNLWRVLSGAVARFSEDDAWAIASHIALSGLTSIFPFLIFVGAITGLIGAPGLAAEASKLIFDAWPPEVAAPIANQVNNVLTQPRSGLATLSAFLSIYFASSGLEALRVGLNRAYGEQDRRSWWILRLESVLFVFLSAIALIAFAFLVVFAPLIWTKALAFVPKLESLSSLFNIVRWIVILVVLVVTLFLLHRFLAAGARSFRDLAPGVFLTCFLWIAFGEGFGLYLAHFSQNYFSTYAGLASVMITIVFLYTLSAIFILGGEVNAAILRERAHKIARKALGVAPAPPGDKSAA